MDYGYVTELWTNTAAVASQNTMFTLQKKSSDKKVNGLSLSLVKSLSPGMRKVAYQHFKNK